MRKKGQMSAPRHRKVPFVLSSGSERHAAKDAASLLAPIKSSRFRNEKHTGRSQAQPPIIMAVLTAGVPQGTGTG